MRINYLGKESTSFVKATSFGKIKSEKKLDLVLLKYWNLYDSLMFSNSTLSKLKSWHEKGIEKIQEMVLLLGIPLEEAK